MEQTTSSLRSRARFTTLQVLYAVALFAASFALFGVGSGTIVATLYLLPWLLYFANIIRRRTACISALVMACLLAAGEWAGNNMANVRWAVRATHCQNQMRQIGIALLNFEAANGKFASAMEKGPEGVPFSWRIAISPWIENSLLYDRYDFSQPWDGISNSKLLELMPSPYACPEDPLPTRTQYKLVTGPGSAFVEGRPLRFNDMKDSPSSIIILIEDQANPVQWTCPEDLTVDEAVKILSSTSIENSSHCDRRTYQTRLKGNHVVMMDGSCHRIPPGADPELLRQAMNPFDGLEPDLGFNDKSRVTITHPQAHVAYWILLSLWILPIALVAANDQRVTRDRSTANQATPSALTD